MFLNLCKSTGEVIAIIVHQMITIATELISQFFYDASDFLIIKICATYLYTLAEMELFAQFFMISRCDLKNSGKRKRMSAISKLCAKYFYTRVKDAQTYRCCILIYPVLK